MWHVLFYVFISFSIPVIMLVVSKMFKSIEYSVGVFECGFDSYNVSVLPISLRFFMFCIIFLMLDLELIIVSLSPIILFSMGFMVGIFVFLSLVTLSVLFDWLYGSLSWIE